MTIAAMIIRLFLSVILIRAALHKIRAGKKFEAELQAYQLLPGSLLPFATWLLVFAEITCSLLLLDPVQNVAVLAAAGLFALYAGAMAINLLRGRADINCGCAGPLATKKQIRWVLVIRNLILSSLALLCTTPIAIQNPDALGLFVILAGATVSLFLYEAIEQTIANTQGYQRWTH